MSEPQNQLKLYPYNLDYPKKFAKYREQILQSLKDYKVGIYHIGSTAVEGLGGKGFIDILISLPDWTKEEEIIERLKSLGFTHIHLKENERIFLSKPPEDRKNYDVHLHLVIIGSKPYKEMIYFRDYLRNNLQTTQEYYSLKLQLSDSTRGNRKQYTQNKAKFIEKICSGFNNSHLQEKQELLLKEIN